MPYSIIEMEGDEILPQARFRHGSGAVSLQSSGGMTAWSECCRGPARVTVLSKPLNSQA
jgi:hypothetical protein